jgi:hypothetical protein
VTSADNVNEGAVNTCFFLLSPLHSSAEVKSPSALANIYIYADDDCDEYFTDIYYLFSSNVLLRPPVFTPKSRFNIQDLSTTEVFLISNDKTISGLGRNFISHAKEKDSCVHTIPVGIRVRLLLSIQSLVLTVSPRIARNAKSFDTWCSYQGCEQVAFSDLPGGFKGYVDSVFNTQGRLPMEWVDAVRIPFVSTASTMLKCVSTNLVL